MDLNYSLIDQLICQGVTQFCIAPGARSAPLVSAAFQHPQAQTIVHFDERGLAFYALGFGKGAKVPAAIIVTSGSAVGHLLPAIMEAHHSCTPLVLLTADRPPELRACGANQTTEQASLFAPFVRWQVDLPPTLSETYFRSIAAQAVFHATHNPPGPVHLNCQIRDPYHRPALSSLGTPIPSPLSELRVPPHHAPTSHGLIVIGEIPSSPRPILDLARRLGWPVCADLLSNARLFHAEEEIRSFDSILQLKPDLKPDFLLHFGTRLTSTSLLHLPIDLHISPYPFLQDPSRTLRSRVRSDIAPFCEMFTAGPCDPHWLKAWKEAEQEPPLLNSPDIQIMIELANKMPPDTLFFCGNSTAIRNANAFFFPKICGGIYGHRGLSGIDGNIALAAGIADGTKKGVVAWIGDQAALHDLNSLPFLKKTKVPVTLIISNNFGGGLFTQLPYASWPELQTHIQAVHSTRFQAAAKLFDLPYLPFDGPLFQESAIVELVLT